MIKILKKEAPVKLITKGTLKTLADIEEYKINKVKYDSGVLKFEAEDSIYNSDVVREKLEEIQKNKCCYCETKSTRSNIDVEHFRPKKAYSSRFKGESLFTGYFWLAYEWDNLFLSCQVCNQIFKNDFFPVRDETTRAKFNDLSIQNEYPYFVHPSSDEPEDEIEYRESIPIGKTEKGKKTIAYLGFGSLEHGKEFDVEYSNKHKIRILRLFEERELFYKEKELIFKAIKVLEKDELDEEKTSLLNSLKDLLSNTQKSESEWSLMIKCALKNEFKQS